MAVSEFDLIARYFTALTAPRDDVALGIGDDCALLSVPSGRQLAVSTDTLVAGRHFSADVDPRALGHKCLAVNLSDLAAMGAEPAWVSLALTLPEVDEDWLAAFADGFATLATQHGVQLIGGDTTRGPLSITIQVQGFVEPDLALCRAGAAAGDLVYVSGTLGDAGLALAVARAEQEVAPEDVEPLSQRLHRPVPRVALGRALRGLASAAIDVSDGLASDLAHICQRSGLGATLELERLPLSRPVASVVARSGEWTLPLAAGDDYELCFTAAADRQAQVEALAAELDCPLTRVGVMESQPGVRLAGPDGAIGAQPPRGFDHFA